MNERLYIAWRMTKAFFQSIPFYLFRIIPIDQKKIVFTTIEGTTGFTCNPKYIALELIRRNENLADNEKYKLVWLVNDTSKQFPNEIKKVKNSLWNRAYELTTARWWIDNSRKQLECRKRSGQTYIQTWHAKLGFKPTCLDRGASFSRIAYLVSKHDSDMVDCWLSNSDWYDATLKTGSLYEGKIIRTGSPRCDILVRASQDVDFKRRVKENIVSTCNMNNILSSSEDVTKDNNLDNIHFMMYAPTFRGGSQGTNRTLSEEDHMPEFGKVIEALEKQFGGRWVILLRLHPQLTARSISSGICQASDNPTEKTIVDISRIDDMYEILAGCDAFMTDYSSAAFDAAVMDIPIFLFCDDYREYEYERGKLLWDLRELPFIFSENDDELALAISLFDVVKYHARLQDLFSASGMIEDGEGSQTVLEYLIG